MKVLMLFLLFGTIAGFVTWLIVTNKGSSGSSGSDDNGGNPPNPYPGPYPNPNPGPYPNPNPPPQPTSAQSQEFLNQHNKYRTSAGLSPLQWSDTLATRAGQWGSYLASQRDPSTGCAFRHPSSDSEKSEYLMGDGCSEESQGQCGQNLGMGQGSVCEVVSSWFNGPPTAECTLFTGDYTDASGHYSQIMWPDAKYVGCSVTQCPAGSIIYTCNYDQGNIEGEFGGVPKGPTVCSIPSPC
jgi:uncharacterized protein YkwD